MMVGFERWICLLSGDSRGRNCPLTVPNSERSRRGTRGPEYSVKITTTPSRRMTTAGEPRPSLRTGHCDTSGHPTRMSYITGGFRRHVMEEEEEEKEKDGEEAEKKEEKVSAMSPGCLSSEGDQHKRQRSDCPGSSCRQHHGTSPTASSGRRGQGGGGRSQAEITTVSGTLTLSLTPARQGGATAGGGTPLVPTERSREETDAKRGAPR